MRVAGQLMKTKMDKPVHRRRWRNFLVDPGFQLRLAGALFLLIVAVAVALCLTLLSPAVLTIQTVDEYWTKYISAQLFLLLMDRIVLILLFLFIVAAIYFIVFSHRLCGPLVNLGHTLDCLGRGDLTRPVFLRRRDFLKVQAAKMNVALTFLNDQIRAQKRNQALLRDLAGQLPAGDVPDRIHRVLSENQNLLDAWSVSPVREERE